jgi:hypothetical protein
VVDDAKPGGHTWSNPLVIAGQTAGVGFVSFIFILLILTWNPSMPPRLFVPITFFYFAALFGICLMIMRHGASTATAEKAPGPVEASVSPAYLQPITTAQLEEGREFGIESVTDATTRTLDKVGIKREK